MSQTSNNQNSCEESLLFQLIGQSQQGDRGAQNELYSRCRGYLAILARTRLESWSRSKVDASDLVQQTMLDVHRNLRDFRGQTMEEWKAWVRKILNHNALDIARRFQTAQKRQANREVSIERMRVSGDSQARYDPADSLGTPSQFLMKHERDLMLADAIMELPDEYREVILLRNLQRLPFAEVARRMQRSRGAVQMLWLRALRKLEEQLADNEQP